MTPRPHTIEYLRDKQINSHIPAEQIYRIRIDNNNNNNKQADQKYLNNFGMHYKRLFEKLMDKSIQSNPIEENSESSSSMWNDIFNNLNFIRLHRSNESVSLDSSETLKRLSDYVLDGSSRQPLILHGRSGSGKTSLISTFASNLYMQLGISHTSNQACVFRFIGVDQNSSMLSALLKSICEQIYFIRSQKSGFKNVPSSLRDLKTYFKECLTSNWNDKDDENGKLVVIIDCLDGLIKDFSSYKLDWIPNVLHSNCKLILTVADESRDLVEKLRRKLAPNGEFVEMSGLGDEVGKTAVKKFLYVRNYRLEDERLEKFTSLIGNTRPLIPLHLKLLLENFLISEACSEFGFHSTFEFTINRWVTNLERKFGSLAVKHILSN